MKSNKTILLGGIGVLVALGLIFYLAISVIPKTLILLTKASGSAKVSVSNSIIMGEKVLAAADGKDKCVVNVFALDSKGKGVSNRQVQLSGLIDQTVITDSVGKARFEMTSNEARQYELTAIVSGMTLGKKIKVTFR